MSKKWLTKAADRSFGLIAAVLMRRAIGRLIHIEERALSEAGLSRVAVADFLASPLGTDPHRFFSRRHAQSHQPPVDTDQAHSNVSTAVPEAVQRNADGSIAYAVYRARAGRLRRTAILRVVRQAVGFRMRILTAGVLVVVGALGACSGSVPDRDTAQIRREQSLRCRLRLDSFTLSTDAPSKERTANVQPAVSGQQHSRQPEARAGPPGRSG